MRRIVYAVLFVFLCFNLKAQKASVVIDIGCRNKMENASWGIGGQFRYSLFKDFRLASDVIAYFPQDGNFGLDVGLNVQYLFRILPKVSVYPVAGLIISNHSLSAEPNARNMTDSGFSFGLGAELNIFPKGFINADCRYSIISKEKPY